MKPELIKFEPWTGMKGYSFRTGEYADPALIIQNYSALARTDLLHVVETDLDGETFYSFNSISRLRREYDISDNFDNETALNEIAKIINDEKIAEYEKMQAQMLESENEVTLEERRIAALEMQNMISLLQLQKQE